ncbi:hypothetical protein SAMN04487906_0732 [Zhouia amylolytica]|uniref:Uncharacterized protein n=1 Tax=Zhouia amylolytica TaxID=376730 RepID=A0A1I6QMA7_9FLAO|nr:hypothetical protein [Zhouia amylolytica]SFS53589.1 hypothetical protein SAMN04487906_0732 [Zhouia amylolytica]
MNITPLPTQPNTIVSYFNVGRLLHYSLILFILEAWIYGVQLIKSIEKESTFWIVFWISFFLFAFLHIFLVIMDGWSRFQNYKRAKDQFYMHGFNRRIANTYIGSKCQRNAAIVAAKELGLEKEIIEYYKDMNVKWYHFVPYFMVKDPLFMFRKKFWSRTFLEKNYQPKFDYKKIQLEFSR